MIDSWKDVGVDTCRCHSHYVSLVYFLDDLIIQGLPGGRLVPYISYIQGMCLPKGGQDFDPILAVTGCRFSRLKWFLLVFELLKNMIVFAFSVSNGSQQLNNDLKMLWQYADRWLAEYNFKKPGPAEDTYGFLEIQS